MRARTQLAISFTAIALYGCALQVDGHDRHPGRPDPGTSSTTSTTTHPEVGSTLVLVPATCDEWARPIQEDDSPYWSPDGGGIDTYDAGAAGNGCATYVDGWAYDGNGWHAPTETEVQP